MGVPPPATKGYYERFRGTRLKAAGVPQEVRDVFSRMLRRAQSRVHSANQRLLKAGQARLPLPTDAERRAATLKIFDEAAAACADPRFRPCVPELATHFAGEGFSIV
jgi:hypothetical protein